MKSLGYALACLILLLSTALHGQIPGLEAKNWYFGAGTDGFIFDNSNIPYKVSNKMNNVGFEGIVVVSDPLSGALLFYSDGQTVVDASHTVMFNGSGLFGHSSGAQTVQCVPIPNQLGKFYLFTSRAWDLAGDNLFYSVVDFTDPGYPLGKITNKNTLLSGAIYGQANKVISKPNTTDYWWVGHVLNTNTYHIISITNSGFSAPVTYTATGTSSGDSYVMSYSPMSQKLAVSGLGALGLIMMDFNSTTGVASNPQQILSVSTGLGNFSPDGSKLYFLMSATGVYRLHQYDLTNGAITNMGTCCYAHDTKTGPDGKMYHIHTYSSSTPIAVINNPNLSAVGNACGYVASAPTIAGLFNGQVRRFPEFVVMPVIPPLGATFTSFSAVRADGHVQLDWTISADCPNCTFEVERGNGHGNYAVVGNAAAHAEMQFSLSDPQPLAQEAYYRIKVIDADGKFAYSSIQQVSGLSAAAMIRFPNPCHDVLHLVGTASGEPIQVEVVDALGKLQYAATVHDASFDIDVQALRPGIYFLRLRENGKMICSKFEKQ